MTLVGQPVNLYIWIGSFNQLWCGFLGMESTCLFGVLLDCCWMHVAMRTCSEHADGMQWT